MKNTTELFQIINELVTLLGAVEKKDIAIKLEEALTISTVPSEILGEIRLRLQEISQDRLNDSQIDQKVHSALRYLNDILG